MTRHKVVYSGKFLKDLRRRLGLTQGDLALRLSCDVESIKQWEAGVEPDDEYINQLVGLLKIADANAQKIAQSPWADSIILEKGLSQISKDEITNISDSD